ncbi:MAG: HlyC/CorC family transporter [Planctomycetes bacterium]|nr:HlyC/CorC family transporter [Planctomycetota bacterium]
MTITDPATGALDFTELALNLRELAWVGLPLLACGLFQTLRLALQRASPVRILPRVRDSSSRARIEQLLTRADHLAQSAGILALAAGLAFTLALVRHVADGESLGLRELLLSAAIALPVLLICAEAVPAALALRLGDGWIARTLPAFHVLQLPIAGLVRFFEVLRRALLRVAGSRQDPRSSRAIVEGLREVIEENAISGALDETEKEIIGNVMEARDVNVAAIMTPRTEIQALEIGEGLAGAAQRVADSGHSRVPVYEGSLDRIVGVVTARDVLGVAAEDGLETERLRSILRPAWFVPETKPVSELLSEFKREKLKLAVVLDEYGGTAGVVTLGDVMQQLVGDIQDEFDEAPRQLVRRLPDGSAEVDASLNVDEVNERLELAIPEDEHYDTLAGFVLSELGHFPRRGEHFRGAGCDFTVLESSERRVYKVLVREVPAENALASR